MWMIYDIRHRLHGTMHRTLLVYVYRKGHSGDDVMQSVPNIIDHPHMLILPDGIITRLLILHVQFMFMTLEASVTDNAGLITAQGYIIEQVVLNKSSLLLKVQQ